MHQKEILILDSAYTKRILSEQKLKTFILGKNSAGVFSHVWHCNPLDKIFLKTEDSRRYGFPGIAKINKAHSFIDGKMGISKKIWFLPRFNFLLAQIKLFFYLSDLCRQRPIQAIRADDPFYNGFLGLILAIRHKLPLVVGVWGNLGRIRSNTKKPIMPKLFPGIWAEEIVEKNVLQNAKHIIVANQDNKKYVLSQGIPTKKVSIFNMGSTLTKIHFKDPKQRKTGHGSKNYPPSPFILVISRLEKSKFVDHVIQALPFVLKENTKVKLILAGDGSERQSILQKAKKLGISSNLVIYGNQTQKWLAGVIPKASVVVAPLAGRALAEAALGSAPIVAYELDWHGEVIESNKTGLLVPFPDIQGLSQAILKILKNPKKAKKMGQMARNKAFHLLNPQEAQKNQKQIYLKLITQK